MTETEGLMTECCSRRTDDRGVRAGVKWLVFFQDTNGLIFRSMAAVLGVSKKHDLGANSVCVPRTPGEAVGGICRFACALLRSPVLIAIFRSNLDVLRRFCGAGSQDTNIPQARKDIPQARKDIPQARKDLQTAPDAHVALHELAVLPRCDWVRLKRPDGSAYTINVEYNQLDPLLRSTSEFAQGDAPDPGLLLAISLLPNMIFQVVASPSRRGQA
jgi:hypothetical protein